MATITQICALNYVAKILGEDLELLEAIVWNDDKLTYGSIISVHTGPDEAMTALTDDGIEELTEILAGARRSPEEWTSLLNALVSDPDTIARVKENEPR